MTSQIVSTAATSPAIVWDKHRLHAQRARALQSNGRAHPPKAAPTSSAAAPRRVSNMTPSSAPTGRPSHKSSPESELKMSFDPMRDLHMWTMWRVAVNGRIVDETRRRNRAKSSSGGDSDPNPYGRALVKTPLDRFIRVENGSQGIAGVMMDPHGEKGRHLATKQFVYFGVPRVVLKSPKQTVTLPQ